MNYIEAFELLKDGKHLARCAWDLVDEKRFCMLVKGINFVMAIKYNPSITHTPTASFANYLPLMEDLEANDWYIKETSWNHKEECNEPCVELVS